MKKLFYALCVTFMWLHFVQAQEVTFLTIQPNEKWWGGATNLGSKMPYQKTNPIDLGKNNFYNQSSPLLISNQGRYIWSEEPFSYQFMSDTLKIVHQGKVDIVKAGATLRDAYLAVAKAKFGLTGTIPPEEFFTRPQYNTWIELIYNQTQEGVMRYARGIVENGFPTGVLMIDDNWQKYYGSFDFDRDVFPTPKEMVDTLHNMGFKVMVWVCPYVRSDGQYFLDLRDNGYLVKDEKENVRLIHWWNGYSAGIDLLNPAAANYFSKGLQGMQQRYGIDGFKLDGGDVPHYPANGVLQSEAWAKLGLQFPYNEYRACWKMAGQPLVQRLSDKGYHFGAIQQLIPEMLAAGLLGYAYTCPDMIGGGQYTAFINFTPEKVNQRLIVRSCQVHAMMPMMQFSVAPWRVLDKQHLDICRKYALLHQELSPYIIELARHASQTGEPIVRHLEYAFPNEGFADCKDQFMLGDRYLVAPVLDDKDIRTVKLPKGKWKDDLGKVYKGGKSYTIDVPIERLLYFEKVGK